MELSVEQLEIIKEASKKITDGSGYGQIVIDFTGDPSFTVDIKATENHRFQRYKSPKPKTVKLRSEPTFRQG